MFMKLFSLPSRHLSASVPLALALGLALGFLMPISQSPALSMPAVLLMVYPIMIGVPWKQVMKLEPWRLMLLSTLFNFLLIPAIAFGLGRWMLADQPAMLAGLMIAALLPTSGMTISWTTLSGGNVPAAIRITVLSLLAGSLLMPLYLLGALGESVPLDFTLMLARLGMTVLLPMILGSLTYTWLLRRYTQQEFQTRIKPVLAPISVWAMLYVVFISTASKAQHLLADPGALVTGFLTVLLLYLTNFVLATLAGRWFLDRADAYTLVYTTVLRNLSIALGMALAIFGPQAAFVVTLAFVLQVQSAAWYDRIARYFGFFEPAAPVPSVEAGD